MKIKKNDLVKVTAGKAAGASVREQQPRRVTEVLEGGDKVIVEGVNVVFKHVKKGHPKSPGGGRLKLEMPISSSNVQYFCSACNQTARLGLRFLADGSKERFCKKCKASAGKVSPANAKYAKKS